VVFFLFSQIATNEVAIQTTSKYTLITVLNYDLYQPNGQVQDQQRANKGPQLIKDNKENNI